MAKGLTALIAAVLILPLWIAAQPAMPDYPAHLASFYLIGGGASAYYHVHWAALPNLASEFLVPLLAPLFGLDVAAKIFLSLGVAMWVMGPAFLHRALYGKFGIAPLSGALFAFNANFTWGFLNYYFAAGLSLCLFAAWVASKNNKSWTRIGVFAAAVLAVYFCHLFAAAELLLAIICFEITACWGKPRQITEHVSRLVPIALPALAAFLLKVGGDSGGWQFNIADTITDRLNSLIGQGFDHPVTWMAVLLLALLALLLLTGKARLHKSLWLTLCVFLAAAIVAPEEALGGWAVDLRLPAYFAVLLFAATDLRLPRAGAWTVAGAALILACWNAAALTGNWIGYDKQWDEFRQAARELPRGVEIVTVLDSAAKAPEFGQPYWHMADYAIVERGGLTSLMFATKDQHVIQVNSPYGRIVASNADQGAPPGLGALNDLAEGKLDDETKDFSYLAHFPCHYDVALVIGAAAIPPPSMLRLRHRGSYFSLYDLKHGACP